MPRRLSLLLGTATIAASLLAAAATDARADGYRYNPALFVPTPILRWRACGADYRVPCQRGVAILSPVESPDHCDYVVGGKPLCVPYYVDYSPHWCKGP